MQSIEAKLCEARSVDGLVGAPTRCQGASAASGEGRSANPAPRRSQVRGSASCARIVRGGRLSRTSLWAPRFELLARSFADPRQCGPGQHAATTPRRGDSALRDRELVRGRCRRVGPHAGSSLVRGRRNPSRVSPGADNTRSRGVADQGDVRARVSTSPRKKDPRPRRVAAQTHVRLRA